MKQLLSLLVFTLLLSNCAEEPVICDTTPSFGPVTSLDISYSSFRVSGSINLSDCDDNFISKGIVYSTNPLPTTSDQKILFSESDFSVEVENLLPSTEYYIRSFLVNQDGEFYSGEFTVTTLSILIEFNQINSNPEINSAQVEANYNFQEGAGYEIAEKGVVFNNNKIIDNTTSGNVIKSTIENLSPDTNYTFNFYVTTQYGEFQSLEQTFQTQTSETTISSVSSSNISYTSFDLSSTYTNLYSGDEITTDKGFLVADNIDFNNPVVFSSSSDVGQINASITQLNQESIYYVKAFVENNFSTSYSDILEITTLSANYNFTDINVSNITFTSADLNMVNITPTQLNILEKGYYISTSSDFTSNLQTLIDDISTDNSLINYVAAELTTNTTYYVKGFITNEYGTFTSDISSFTTTNISYTYSSIQVNDISFENASISSSFQLDFGELDFIEKGYEYSINSDFDSFNSILDSSSGTNINVDLLNLNFNTTYYIRAFVTNEYGTFTSDISSFTTTNVSYTYSSIQVNDISFENASISSSFQLDFGELDFIEKGYEYSINSDFDSFNSILDSSSGTNINVDLLNLNFNTTYYIRAFVTNEYGTFTSDIENFNTLNSGYDFSNINADNINYSTVNLIGTYNHINSAQVEVEELGFYLSDDINTLNDNLFLIQSSLDLSINLDALAHNTEYFYQAYIKNEFGEFKSTTFSFNTLNATPIFNFELNSNDIQLSSVDPTINVQIRDNTDINSMLINYTRISDNFTEQINFLNDIDSDYNGGDSGFTISQLLPNTTYSLSIKLQNDYGEFESNQYFFTTLNDTPETTYSVVKSGDNSVEVTANFSTPNGAGITRAFIQYKNQDESSYQTIELSTEANSITIDNLVQGPEYDFKLTVENEWNTFIYNEYMILPVTYVLGDEMFGGVVVYIDPSGYHGIIAARMSAIRSKKWSTNLNAPEDFDLFSSEYEDGNENTEIILDYYNSSAWSAPAAEFCSNYTSEGYDDWFLPSASELSFNNRIIQKTMYEKYGGEFIQNYNWLYTSNESSIQDYQAVTIGYNGCANDCSRTLDKDKEQNVLPIRFF